MARSLNSFVISGPLAVYNAGGFTELALESMYVGSFDLYPPFRLLTFIQAYISIVYEFTIQYMRHFLRCSKPCNNNICIRQHFSILLHSQAPSTRQQPSNVTRYSLGLRTDLSASVDADIKHLDSWEDPEWAGQRLICQSMLLYIITAINMTTSALQLNRWSLSSPHHYRGDLTSLVNTWVLIPRVSHKSSEALYNERDDGINSAK